MIQVQAVTKRYGNVAALNGVSLTLEPGKIYGLLGRNGAGKTTLLNLLTGRVLADSGNITLDGATLPEQDNQLNRIYMLSEATLYPLSLKVQDAFRWMGEFYPHFERERAFDMAKQFHLNLRKPLGKLSTGYKTISKLILALCSGAEYILLDEPVLGLDANHRELFYRLMVETYAEINCTIVISTHLVEEISAYVEQIIIVKEGHIIKNESRDELLQQGYSVSGPAAAVEAYIAGKATLSTERLGGLMTANISGTYGGEMVPGLEFSHLDLQKLFVLMTNEGGAA